MKHMQILQRAWNILWSYRTLWIFGIILALTAGASLPRGNGGGGGGGGSSNPSSGNSYQIPLPNDLRQGFDRLNSFFSQTLTQSEEQIIIIIVISLLCLALLTFVVFRIGYYVSQVALVRMVDGYEATGEKATWNQGFRWGWSRPAWRLFLIDLIIYLPVALVFIVLFVFAALPAILGSLSGATLTVAGVISTIGLVFLLIFLAILVTVALSLVMEIMRRVCVLRSTGVMDAIRQGWQMVRRNLKDVAILWLILIGIQIGFFIITIPIVLVLVAIGLVAGGGVGVAVYLLVQSLVSVTAGWVMAAIIGGLLFILILALPLLFLGGLKETYLSTTWTLAYRELNALAPQAE